MPFLLFDQQVVGQRVPLAGRTREEDEPEHQVVLHAAPGGVEVADAGLRPQVALAGGLEEPARGRGIVALQALPLVPSGIFSIPKSPSKARQSSSAAAGASKAVSMKRGRTAR